MMPTYITVDSGTTNTRVSLLEDEKIIDSVKFKPMATNVKSRQEVLSEQLKVGIDGILARNGKKPCDIERIIACGMISSEIGLITLEHINSPCGLKELAKNLYETVINSISEIPFVFIRGVKCVSSDGYVDVMRGEEAEIYGICKNPDSSCMYVLPGSHSKLIYIDDDGRISHFSTELTGEMIGAIASNTILKNTVSLDQRELDEEYLQKGYLLSSKKGMNAALFKVRTLKNFGKRTDAEVFSFFIGSILAPEINSIISSSAKKIIIGGKAQLKEPTAILLKKNSDKVVETVPCDISDLATAYGCVRIYEKAAEL